MAETPKQDSDYADGLGRMISGFRGSATVTAISVSDQPMNSNSDAFIVDLEGFSNGGLDKETTANSRIIMQRSYSKKGSTQGGQHQQSLLASSSSSPRAGGNSNSNSTPEKVYSQPAVVVMAAGATETNNEATVVKTKSRYNSFKRSPPPHSHSHCFSHPKRVLLFFATLSSIGTLFLIYLTLCTSNSHEYSSNPEWEA